MRKLLIFTALVILLFTSCNPGKSIKLDTEGTLWVKYFANDNEIIKEFNKMYPGREHGDIFKFIVDRRNHFVRINIYPIKNLDIILRDLPYSIEKNGKDTFLFYNGMEFINAQISRDELIERLGKDNFKKHLSFSDPKILQFDIDLEKKVKFNFPAANPYDIELLDSSERKFPKIK